MWDVFKRVYFGIFSIEEYTRNRVYTFLFLLYNLRLNDAAAIAANLGLGYDMEIAVEKAIDYVQGAIMHSYPLGKGRGPLNHLYRQRNLPFTP
jgi:hypothetical protein